MFWKILMNWRKIAKIVEMIVKAVEDKKVTGPEAEAVLDEVIRTLEDIGVVEK